MANTSVDAGQSLDVIVNGSLNAPGTSFRVLYSNKARPTAPPPVEQKTGVTVQETDGSVGHGPLAHRPRYSRTNGGAVPRAMRPLISPQKNLNPV